MCPTTVTRRRRGSSPQLSAGVRRAPCDTQAMPQSILERTGPHDVRVRVDTDDDRIETVRLTVVPRDDELDEIDLERHILGYIQQAGHVFVALVGERLDRAEECGQSLLWDRAAADLVRSARQAESSR